MISKKDQELINILAKQHLLLNPAIDLYLEVLKKGMILALHYHEGFGLCETANHKMERVKEEKERP